MQSRDQRTFAAWRQAVVKALSLLTLYCLFLFAGGCEPSKPVMSTSDVVGIYRGKYRGGQETFELRTNGTFTQIFRKNNGSDGYTNEGRWEISGPDYVVMDPLLQCIDNSDKSVEKPKKIEQAYVRYRSEPSRRLEFGGGSHEVIRSD
jgi:hypothetical protein